jgi:hypothetical protein
MKKLTKKELKKINRLNNKFEEFSYNDDLGFIAGYTSGGAPFGLTYEEMNKPESNQTITKSLFEKYISDKVEEMRPPEHIRPELDIGYSFEKYTLLINEIRPRWNNPSEIDHLPFVKARFIKSKNHWKLYWMRGNLKWYSYDPNPSVYSIEELFDIINRDEYGCFKG